MFIYLKKGTTPKFRSDFFQLHRNHQLHFFTMLDSSHRQKFYEVIAPNEFATVFSKLDFTAQQLVIGELDEVYVIALIDAMRTDEIVWFLKELDQEQIHYYLDLLERHDTEQISRLLTYETNTAGAIMTTEFITATEDETVAIVLDRLTFVGKDAETIYYIYIVSSSNQLLGVVSLRDLMISPRGHTMKFIMKEQVISVRVYDHLNKVVKIVKDYDLLLVPIINENNEIMGIITIDDVMNKNTDSSLYKTSHSSRKKQMVMFMILFTGFALVMIAYSLQFQVKATTCIITLVGLIAVVSGAAGALSSVFNLQALMKNKLKKETFLSFIKNKVYKK